MSVILLSLIKSIVIILLLLTGFAYLTYYERKLLGRFHVRLGPNRAGPYGLLQPIADAVKAIFKEEVIPDHVDKAIYLLAPALSLIPALVAFAVVPIAPDIHLFGQTIRLAVADVNVALLYIVAITSVGTYGIILGGWSSRNNYALLGALRTAAQMISYELPLGIVLTAIVLTTNVGREMGTLNLVEIVNQQRPWWLWLWLWLAFPIFFITMLAESNRSPFDLPEAENELIAGYQIEYGGIKFALYMMSEYIGMITGSAIMASLFFGGWHGPFAIPGTWYGPIIGFGWFVLKIIALLFVYIWVRASVPRIRYDQLLHFCWKFLTPLSIVYLIFTAVIV
ncbi:MAG: NADH-quinone oxidoreductase subunit NuoH, partial [Chloroflexi bacterium]|nr:NADH-quinone oxidoreductase subunit NuoH [Chloroflexota bacterium]